jgi:hypothetical protein
MIDYTLEMRAADVRIAKRMGWTQIFTSTEGVLSGRSPYGTEYSDHGASYYHPVPEFHASDDARRALLEWLAVQPVPIRRNFLSNLAPKITDALVFDDAPLDDQMIMGLLLATPEQVARAADAAIREGDK